MLLYPVTHHPASLPLLGREEELQACHHILTCGAKRLLTLTGPPGVGKTVLAWHLMESLKPDFPDGTFFLSLAPLSEASEVEMALAHTLGLHDSPPVFERLSKH